MQIDQKEKRRLQWEYRQWFLYFLLTFAGTLIIWYFAMSEQILNRLTLNADNAVSFLEIHGYWYIALITLTVLHVILTAGFGIKALIFYITNHSNPKYEDCQMTVGIYDIPIAECVLVLFIMLFDQFIIFAFFNITAPLEHYRNCMEDAAAVRTGNQITSDVFFETDFERGNLTDMGPNYHELLMEYHATGAASSRDDAIVYIPDYLCFTVDQEHSYISQNGHDWNRHHATIYRITYTPNCRLVTSVEMIRAGTSP